ncbi:MAG TPA: asparagine synthase (glutamine-hydrolyzing) [Gemmatimonadales bacterium]|nr:asparagine synthase (glutamine-hydrolyzing) [Gemmatimonadales bacterium]
MCGIAGIVSLDGRPVDPDLLQAMTDVQAHRGPDGEGFLLAWRDGGRFEHARLPHTRAWDRRAIPCVGLGHRRLAILDLSARGAQPMAVGRRDAWIVFNGEIYNHRELRAELEARGWTFTTRTDTEVLLATYLEWREACLERLQGMFAFAVWDGREGRLFCARDRLGIKPFYYARVAGQLVFASEIKALTACPGLDRSADDEAVIAFLVHSNCDYGERTVFRNVRALPGGHALTADVGTGQVRVAPYWRLAPQPLNGASDRDHVRRLRALLLDTTERHLISDVRAGSCLSGGLDSSTVVSLAGHIWRNDPQAARALGDSLYTFTSCYDLPEFDERRYALAVAGAVGAKAHLVFPTPVDFWSVFQRMAWHQDMPFGAFSYYAQWRVMQAARDAGVKVLLDGQGGDEVFGGYAKFRYAYLLSLLRAARLPQFARELGGTLLQGDLYVLDIRRGYRYLPRRLRGVLGVDSLLRDALRGDWNRAVSAESTPATRWWRHARAGAVANRDGTIVQRIQVDDIVTDTLPQLLRMEDRSSMAFSLEARVPLLDHPVVEFGLSLPDRLKVRNGWSKFAIREATAGIVPDVTRLRKTKLGFAAPDRRWLGHDLRAPVTTLLQDRLRCERYVDAEAVRRWYDAPAARRASTEAYLGLFRILAVEMWMRAFQVS